MRIDLNADVGEDAGSDTELISLVSSASVCCGEHAGDEATIVRTIELALAAGAAVGAHPGYPDREGFGRRVIDIEPAALEASIVEQIQRVARICDEHGARLRHVKPHGALYNQAARDRPLADLVSRAVRRAAPDAWLLAMAASALVEAGRAAGLPVAEEAFADRAYEPDGRLRSRSLPGAVLTDPTAAADQALSIVRDGRVQAADGTWLAVRVDSLCVHGDTPGAPAIAGAIRAALAATGVEITAFSEP